MHSQSAILNVMVKTIEKATHHWRHDLLELEQLQMAGRSVSEFVAKSYTKTASLLKQELTKARPKYGFISHEESIEANDDPHCWVIEPLDGLHNFARALPYVASSVALLKQGRPYACVIYTPLQQQLFWAEQGSGAFSQARRRLRVSRRKEQTDLVIGTNFNHESWQHDVDHPNLYWRDWGCDTLSIIYTALGSLDAFVAKNEATAVSKAAGVILIREAGGMASDFQGQPLKFPARGIILASESVHKTLLPIVSY